MISVSGATRRRVSAPGAGACHSAELATMSTTENILLFLGARFSHSRKRNPASKNTTLEIKAQRNETLFSFRLLSGTCVD